MCRGHSPGVAAPQRAPAPSARSAESIEEWEDTQEQTGQTLSQTRSLRRARQGQGESASE